MYLLMGVSHTWVVNLKSRIQNNIFPFSRRRPLQRIWRIIGWGRIWLSKLHSNWGFWWHEYKVVSFSYIWCQLYNHAWQCLCRGPKRSLLYKKRRYQWDCQWSNARKPKILKLKPGWHFCPGHDSYNEGDTQKGGDGYSGGGSIGKVVKHFLLM